MIRILQRDNAFTKVIFALIIGATIVLMVIFLVPGIFDNGAAGDATLFATVKDPGWMGRLSSGTPVTMQEVQNLARQQAARQQIPPAYVQQLMPMLMNRAGQIEVERQVLVHEADRLGLQVSDSDLATFLQHGPYADALFPEGKFIGQDKYINFVEQFGLSVTDFETQLKIDLELQRLESLITGGVTVSDAAVHTEALQAGTKVKFDYAVLSGDDVKKSINPSDAELETFFKQNAARYANAVPEQRKISFFAFDNSQLPGGAPAVSDADVQSYYNGHVAQYKTEEEVKTRHILITVAKGADAKTDAAAKAKAQDVLNQLKGGASFADLAKKYSEDPGSKDTGGELPMIPTSGLDPAYAQAAMKLNPGQTSDLVRSSFGYHIIQTEEKHGAGAKPLSEVKDQIKAQLVSTKAAAAAQNYAGQLVAEAGKNGLQKTAEAHHLQVTTTGFLKPTDVVPSLPDSTQLMQSAFVAKKDAAPQMASTGEGFAIFQVADIQAAHAPNFADAKAQILDNYRSQQVPEILQAQLIKLSNRAKELHDLKKAAAELKIPVKSSDLVGRDAQVPDLGSMGGPAAVVFSLPQGGISAPINTGTIGTVIEVNEKQEPTADDLAKAVAQTHDKMLQEKRNEVFGIFVGTLVERYAKNGGIVYSKKQQAAQQSPLGQ
ncbi:peptidyl-prolyl cis-trans isomerase D [Bryocella elongata]|uniref:Periplasmic chaperone PpiD n=1 Tax=Bryocella elongata TaxID=863522 RepID=A0A1H5WXA5_9BACT|nr:peptidylprolyl isomerase [Bryocella elongata]SEG03627.1 peptidyl-prolyl cis-trans isomerase D [Bryocella elongata]